MEEKKNSKKKVIIIIAALVLIALAVPAFFLFGDGGALSHAPAVTIETPNKMSRSDRGEFTLDVTLSDLKEGELYPAASFSMNFDANKLEFLGLEEGNVLVPCEKKANGAVTELPKWGVNVERSNEIGQINVMYLDLTGGRQAFSKDLLPDGDRVLFRLKFKLRGSVQSGDIIEISFADAVFAASDEKDSLASVKNTLKTHSGRVIMGN